MVTQDDLDQLVDGLFEKTVADELEIVVTSDNSALTRYANSRIHQNIARMDNGLSIRAILGKRIGSASTNSLSEDAALETLKRAETIAKHQREDPHFKGLPEMMEGKKQKSSSYVAPTANFSPEERAAAVKDIIDHASAKGVDRVYGSFQNSEQGLYVANTNGIRKIEKITKACLTVTAIADWDNDRGFGWSEACSPDVTKIDPVAVAEVAVEKGLNNIEMSSVEPGEYTVVLEPLAIKSLLMYLSFMGFSSRAVQEQRSFLNGKFGKQIMHENVNIWDDVSHEEMVGTSFDFEGVPKQRVDIIKQGVAKDVVYDSYTAGREEGKKSTGHALPMPNPSSPMTMNLIMDNGDMSTEEMVETTDKGILVTRFNYCGVVHPVKSILTGLTRDGTWLIEDGEISKPLKNLRFTQNLTDAFSNIEGIGKEQKLFSFDYYPIFVLCPALKISNFNFTGGTEF